MTEEISTTTPIQPAPSIPVVEPKSKVEQLTDIKNEVKEIKEDFLIPSDNYLTSPLFYEMVNYFGIPQSDWDNARLELSAILDHVILTIKSNDEDKVLLKLREMEDNLYDRPQEGEKRYKVLYRYIRLASKRDSLTRAMSAFEKEKTNG